MSFVYEDSIFLVTGKDKKSFGTGFIIYKDDAATYFLTCMHVVNDVGGEDDLRSAQTPAKLIASETESGYDLALLKVEKVLEPPALLLGRSGMQGLPVQIIGYSVVGGRYHIHPVSGSLKAETKILSTDQMQRSQGWFLKIQDDFKLEPGYSGSPIISKTSEEVIGVINQRMSQGKEGVAISIEALLHCWKGLPQKIKMVIDTAQTHSEKIDPLMNFRDELNKFSAIVCGQDNSTRLIAIDAQSGLGKTRLKEEFMRISEKCTLEFTDFNFLEQIRIESFLQRITTCLGFHHFASYNDLREQGRPEPFTREKEKDWHRSLALKFFDDLVQSPVSPFFIIFLDQYERADSDFKQWLNQVFLRRLVSCKKLLCVITGQEEIKIDAQWPGQYRKKVSGYSLNDYYQIVDEYQIRLPEKDIEFMHRLLNGRPAEFINYLKQKSLTIRATA